MKFKLKSYIGEPMRISDNHKKEIFHFRETDSPDEHCLNCKKSTHDNACPIFEQIIDNANVCDCFIKKPTPC